MGGNINHGGGHDPRFVDLIAVLSLLILSVTAYEIYIGRADVLPSTALIVPSQTTRW